MNNVIDEVKSLDLPLGEYAVMSGAALSAHGIRRHGDVDLLVTPQLYSHLKDQGWEEKKLNYREVEFKCISQENFEAFTLEGFHSKNFNSKVDYEPNVEAIIEFADLIDGVAVCSLFETRCFKEAYGRQKDWRDIHMIDAYFNRMRAEISKPTPVFA